MQAQGVKTLELSSEQKCNIASGQETENVLNCSMRPRGRTCFPNISCVEGDGNTCAEVLPHGSPVAVEKTSQDASLFLHSVATPGFHCSRGKKPGICRRSGLLSPPCGGARSSERGGQLKVSLGRRWLPYVNGPIRRYDVPARVGDKMESAGGAQKRAYYSIDELERRHKEELEDNRLPRVLFAPRAAQLRQFVVRSTEVDPRVVSDEANAESQVQESLGISTELLERKACFDTTIGAVRPYALGVSWRQRGCRRTRPGVTSTAMPLSSVLRDPMEVFVEAMRYQRPTIGIYTYNLY